MAADAAAKYISAQKDAARAKVASQSPAASPVASPAPRCKTSGEDPNSAEMSRSEASAPAVTPESLRNMTPAALLAMTNSNGAETGVQLGAAGEVGATPRSSAREQAVQQRAARRIEREKQEQIDREKEVSFEAWRAAQSAEPELTADNEVDSSEEEERPLTYRSPTGGRSNDALEQKLVEETIALQAEEKERERFINELAPPSEEHVRGDSEEQVSRPMPLTLLRANLLLPVACCSYASVLCCSQLLIVYCSRPAQKRCSDGRRARLSVSSKSEKTLSVRLLGKQRR